jgi:hypothetical protein
MWPPYACADRIPRYKDGVVQVRKRSGILLHTGSGKEYRLPPGSSEYRIGTIFAFLPGIFINPSSIHVSMSMKKITINILVDIFCLITFIPSLVSGLVLYLVLPRGGGRWNGLQTFLDISRNQWLTLHDRTSLAFAILLIIHLLLHWKFFWHIRRYIGPGLKETPAEFEAE